RQEQLGDRRRAERLALRAADQQVLERTPAGAVAPGIVLAGLGVVDTPELAVELEAAHAQEVEVLPEDRQRAFGVELLARVLAVDGRDGGGAADAEALWIVRREAGAFLAPLDADHAAQRAARQVEQVAAEVGGVVL